jgi:hypothetical protein
MTSAEDHRLPRLPEGVDFVGVAWTDEEDDLRRRIDTRLLPYAKAAGATERIFAVARYTWCNTWRIEIGAEQWSPPHGPSELTIYPIDYRLDSIEDGMPSGLLRAIPMRHAKAVTQRALWRRFVTVMLAGLRVEDEYRTDRDWAYLAWACTLLAEAGVDHLGAALNEAWPEATAAVWTSRIHRLRRNKRFLVNDEHGKLVLSPEALRLIGEARAEKPS